MFFFPGIIFFTRCYYTFWSRFPCAELELLGCPEWTRFSICRGCSISGMYFPLPRAQCTPTREPWPAQAGRCGTQCRLPRPQGNRAGSWFRFFCFNAVLFSESFTIVHVLEIREHDPHMHVSVLLPFYFHIHHHRVVSRFPCTIQLDLSVHLIDEHI